MIPPVVEPGDVLQRLRMPNAAGVVGKSMRVVSVSGDTAQIEWADAAYTSGTYANPAWITELASTKITGTLTKLQQHAQTAYLDAANTFVLPVTVPSINFASSVLQNIALGFESLSVATGAENTGVGYRALKANTTGILNVAVGHSSLTANTTGGEQAAFGYEALASNTTGGANTAIGFRALKANTTGNLNIAIGHEALQNSTTASQLIAIGRQSLKSNTSGAGNLAIGDLCLRDNTTGFRNVSIGSEAMLVNTTGAYNVAFGWNALKANIDADDNTAIGYSALSTTTTGEFNTAVGYRALDFNTTGSYNTAIGWEAGARIDGFSTPNTTGSNSVFVGRWASPLADGQTNQIVIGYEAVGAGSNTVTIGNASIVSTILRGNVIVNNSGTGRVVFGPDSYIQGDANELRILQQGSGSLYQDFGTSVIFRRTSDFATVANITSAGAATFNGDVYIQGVSGGWAKTHGFKGSAGTNLGGYGAVGTSDTLEYLWIGPAFNNYFIRHDGTNFSSKGINSYLEAPSGGWAAQYAFKGSSGTNRGGFGAVGSSDALTYYWIGPSYSSPYMTLDATKVAFEVSPQFKADTWLNSSEPNNRLLFGTDAATYLVGYGSTPIIVRNGAGVNIFGAQSTGDFSVGTASPGNSYTRLLVYKNLNERNAVTVRNDEAGSSATSELILQASATAWGIRTGSAANNSNALEIREDALGANTLRFRMAVGGAASFNGNVDAPAFTATVVNNGSVAMSQGGVGNTGYFAWFKPNGTRHTFAGFDAGNDLSFTNEVGGGFSFNGPVTSTETGKLGDYTAGTLPSAATYAGYECNVTDSSVTTFGATVAGGGSNNVKVRSNGTNWTVTGI